MYRSTSATDRQRRSAHTKVRPTSAKDSQMRYLSRQTEQEPKECCPLLVAAIDFGTTYSGWAFSFKNDFDKDPTKVCAKNWTGDQLVSSKTPTCVLINPDGKTLDSFGYEAETKYAELATDELHKPWFFFRRFKMMLFDKMKIQRQVTLEDETGKRLPAKTVFSLAIHFLKNDLLKECHNQLADVLQEEDIQWVLTVPAIWNDAAKQFMREAAEDAGILRSKLMIALEPEAASLFCRHLAVQKGDEDMSLASFKSGTKYIVVDAGGGTIDITVHQVIVDGKLRELHKASGGAWGGTEVDKAYEQFIACVAGKETFQVFKEEHMDDYIDLFRTFEVKKREISPQQSTKVTFRIPPSLAETILEATGHTIKDRILLSEYRDQVWYQSGKLRVDADVTRTFFQKSVDSIITHISSLTEKQSARNYEAILMVGGFSESKVLQDVIRNKFGDGMKIIIPEGAGLAVLKGAVIFGHRPSTIAERICKYTYGESSNHRTSENCKHPPTKTRDYDGVKYCRNIFDKHVTVGQTVKLEEEQKEMISYPISDDQTEICYKIYTSSLPDPLLVTELGCVKVGEITIPILDTTLGRKRKFGSRFIFGGTEIAVKVEDKATGEVHIQTVDFLE
ncbi:heat shock 70 kDa protein 12A-like isoform X2 [Mercenaria mercenaria]|uniref:heat shock 70 kDa protein 12A-like isoform X2 n=1 Tax=Mercenaria mercenaria TaxID=6596 RepID=UPI00234F3F96|nr:heat shock 70 kDa protein 12A-like isoform X2 [Mercenaria mercenaria]XP_053399340.1 heat shock 70 kDa protein 12A-like isoform X2 [Mercenaria mercenaria]